MNSTGSKSVKRRRFVVSVLLIALAAVLVFVNVYPQIY